ncbi:Hypothetical protein KVN_LOCUS325 [uncultured virus]|nr:Hypothetical protein KVN_LOCUS325 [uncultured virus]
MHNKSKYKRYQLTYPLEGNIYQTRSFHKAIKKSYNDFKRHNKINEGIFIVTNLDNKKEYKFKINENKFDISQKGGLEIDLPTQKTKEELFLELNLPNETKSMLNQNESIIIELPKNKPTSQFLPVISEASNALEELENEIEDANRLPNIENEENIDEKMDKKLFNVYKNINQTNNEIKKINMKLENLFIKENPKLPPTTEIEFIPNEEEIKIDIKQPKSKDSKLPLNTNDAIPLQLNESSVSIKIDEQSKCNFQDTYGQALKQLETYQYMKQLEKNENDDYCVIL